MKISCDNAKEILLRAGLDIRSAERPSSGFASAVFFCNIGGRQAYVTLLSSERFQVLLYLHQRLGKNCFVPIASIEDHGYDKQTDNFYLVQTPIAGLNLKEILYTDDLLREAGELLRKVHSVILPGYGQLVCNGTGDVQGKYDTWGDFLDIQVSTEKISYLSAHGILLEDHCRIVRNTCEELSESASAPGSLLHNDYHKGHIYSDGKVISGIIDWGAAIIGVAEYDLAISAHFMGSNFPKLLKGYGPDVNLEYVQKYQIVVAVHKMFWAHTRQHSRIEKKRNVLDAALIQAV